jgi:glycosyl transferase, family 25
MHSERDDELRTWVINLDRAPERLARISARLAELQLPYTRLAAIDARALRPDQAALLNEPEYARKHGKTPLLGELGCYLSHVDVMREFVASTARFALVLEDDVKLLPTLPAVLQGLMAIPGRWDVVKLSGVHSGTPVRVASIAPDHELAVMLSRCTGSSAYLMNRKAAAAYLHPRGGLLPMSLPYDHVFDQGWRFGLKVRMARPWPCGHDDQVPTTIAGAGASRKFPFARRLPAFAYRLGNEWARVNHGVASVLREKLGADHTGC